ncbi:MAG TPA: flagellar motor protein MotB [Symbiobacteriaceae bacterium]|nr:flagellar motor protein MotB [Symbiobacteriaceae bacterium]
MATSRRGLRRGVEPDSSGGAPGWSLTYGNLMVALVAFFVLMLSNGGDLGGLPAAAGGEEQSLPVASLSSIKRRLAATLEANGAEELVQFEMSADGGLILRLDAGATFGSGSAEIMQGAVPALDAVGGVLSQVGNSVRVEGHTDDIPMRPTPQYPDNWALSSARANVVLRYLHDYYQIASGRLSVAGYADSHPVAPNSTPQGRAKNRRVDIVVLPR